MDRVSKDSRQLGQSSVLNTMTLFAQLNKGIGKKQYILQKVYDSKDILWELRSILCRLERFLTEKELVDRLS